MANVARLDINPMSPGQPTSGNSSGGGKRSKSGEFASVSETEATAGPQASKTLSVSPTAPDIDSDWEVSEKPSHSSATASAQALAPKRVISIGPPATTPSAPPTSELERGASAQVKIEPARSVSPKEKRRQIEPVASNVPRKVSAVPAESKSDIALLNRRSRATESKSKANPPPTPKPGSLSNGVDPSTLKKLLTEGPESDFDPSDIARLVTNVMGSQPPPATPAVSKKPAFPTVSSSATVSSSSVLTVSTAPSAPAVAAAPLPTVLVAPTVSSASTVSSVPLVSTRQSAPPPSLAAVLTSAVSSSVAPRQSENIAENIMEPDGWDVSVDVPAVEEPAAVPTAKAAQTPDPPAAEKQTTVPTAKPAQTAVKAEVNLKSSDKPAAKSSPASEKPRSKADTKKKGALSAKSKPQTAPEGLESELSGEFFAISAPATAHVEEFHDHDELIDERHMRSISPEVRARRARYRVIVLLLVVGMTLLLAAAIALKMLHKH